MTEETFKFIYYLFILSGLGVSYVVTGTNRSNPIIVYLYILLIACFIGNRPVDVGTDTIEYYYIFNSSANKNLSDFFHSIEYGNDITIRIIFYLISQIGDFNLALISVSFLTLALTFEFSRKFIHQLKFGSSSILFFLICSSFSYYGMQINIIRIGLAMPMVLLFTNSILTNQRFKALIWGILSLATHFSTIIPLLLMVWVNSTHFSIRVYKRICFIAIIIAAMGYGILNFIPLSSYNFSKIQTYTSNIAASDYTVGFRPLFVIFNLIFLFLFQKFKDKEDIFKVLFKYYILASTVFFLWFQIPFSDRIGAFSWYYIPIILYIGLITMKWKIGPQLKTCIVVGYIFLNILI